ncbi:Vacuolar protein sorting-associated protein 39 homolog [Caenorhabditis elegans]|uniref:Isoform a of Vacuolar protein sorting-associated protein 39 homolog n=1 Tax=Caenorhabditis elegans TaxID=6239 RepID=Q1ZXS5-2|nr:Vacuolar protein sorting-associated protein 39 homolog [Caenorhabditis elegans]CAB04720.1 Vacuolar protein sorting-associated protein 39 homolog [Caenorhabditis elegans]|eukprot:NP_001041163.1 Vacuolar protein sorting-associated protein 39 homolog [Caenorhabditis elegans]
MYDAYTPCEVALRLPVEVTCLAFQESNQTLLAGGRAGHLYAYTISANRRGFELTNICKSFHKKAVMELKVCQREDLLLCVSDGQLMAHKLSDPEYKVETLIHKVKPVQTFARFSPKTSGDLYVIVSSRKKLYLFKWGEKDGHKEFIEVALDYNPVFLDTPTSIRCVGEMVFFSVRNEYFSMTMQKDKTTTSPSEGSTPEGWNGFVTRLLNFNCQPGIVPMIDRRRVAFVRNEIVVTTDIWGQRPANVLSDEYKFSEVPMQIVYDSPYLVGMLSKGRVEVRSIFDGQLVQTMSLPKAMTLCSGARGQVFVAALSDIWILDTSQNLRKNVSHLIQERHFELAIQLAENSNLFAEEQKLEIKKKAALNLFNQKKFDESFALFGEIKTDISEVLSIIRMFPELLPDGFQSMTGVVSDMPANDRMRALLALGSYLSEIRTEHAKHIELYNRLYSSGAAKKTDEDEKAKLLLTLRVVDTTLLKCYIKTKPMLVDSLIRLQSNACTFEDAKKILESEGRLRSLFILYETRKKHEMALDLFIDQSSRPDADPFFDDAIQQIVEYLQSLGNSNLPLILKYAKWVLAKNLEAGVQIFTSDETEMARNLNRKAVVEFLKSECPDALIPYLEHVIFKWEEPSSYFHETLLEFYVARVNTLFKDYVHAFPDDENITRAGDEDGELGLYRKRLLKFLEVSHSYSPQTVLLQLAPHAFYEERALILGRLKQHEQALAIYVNTLKNVPAAEEYCRLYYNAHDETNSQVYLMLFRTLVHPNQQQLHSIPYHADSTPFGSYRDDVSEASTLVNSTSSYQPDVNTAIKILAKHADKIDTVGALNMLPATTPLRVVFSAINAVIQTTGRQASTRKMEKSVSQCAMSKKLERKNKAQSTKIIVNFSSECVVCEKKIAVSAFVRYPDGRLAHLYCHNDSQGGNRN